jgi:hypothetical protein
MEKKGVERFEKKGKGHVVRTRSRRMLESPTGVELQMSSNSTPFELQFNSLYFFFIHPIRGSVTPELKAPSISNRKEDKNNALAKTKPVPIRHALCDGKVGV